ncbi:hypothetical protein I5G58_gp096 [Mycobacterium phage BirdsNest]|uniref:HicA-like toxin n=1 Tax=Mycobacterium phage BirdsNest TaxID=2686231 RepID=A0A6B9LCX9_9CAUD|nr:hypothetical protein I5G58_gp096 [Mycobacterium phage BirdsNest]QHB37398.1 hypothetical protein PBI_BIRDSNEST_96 [Mycobacterium phage BirdsNest]
MTRGGPVPGTGGGKRGTHKDVRELLRRIEEAGGEVRPSRSKTGHWKVYKAGVLIGSLAGTPSDWRGLKNALAQLRRAGLDIK